MRVKAMDGETEILRLRERPVMAGLWEARASALGSTDEVSESLTLALGSWGGKGGKGSLLVISHWL